MCNIFISFEHREEWKVVTKTIEPKETIKQDYNWVILY